MGLLPMETVFAEKKTRTRVQGHFGELSGVFAPLSGTEVEGYEIHMGESILKENAGTVTRITDSVSGEKKEEGAFPEMSVERISMAFLIRKHQQKP